MNEAYTFRGVQRSKRKAPAGEATNDLVFSAYAGTSDEVLP